MQEFVHLHNHTHYSLLDAACHPIDLIRAAKEDGQKAIALTDHGVMFGVIDFWKLARKENIKAIAGFEAYVANGSRFDKTAGKKETKKRNYFHLVLLAKNTVGYKNLCKLTSYAHLEGYYYKPRVDLELLRKYNEGIICLSACIAGVVSAPIIEGNYEEALKQAKIYREIYGDDFYIELQNHFLPEDEAVLRDAPRIARELSIPLIATNDVHYVKKEHSIAHNVLLLIKDSNAANSGKMDIRDLRYRSDEMYLKSQAQMIELFKDFPEAISNTVKVADSCDISFERKLFMPEFPIPKTSMAQNLNDYLKEQVEIGLKERYSVITDEIRQRIDFELGTIFRLDYSGYFLIVQDFIKVAKSMSVRVGPGRGSAAGSLIAYCLGITNVDPIRYGLLFERFLNPDRISPPDIDIDFCDTKRADIIEYVKEKYGEDRISQIITFGRMTSKAVLKDVGRVLGVSYSLINSINAKIPVELGKVKPIKEAIELPDLNWLKKSDDPKIKELIEYSIVLEDMNRNVGKHAAGIVITPGNLVDFVPLYKSPTQKDGSLAITTQYPMNDLDEAGVMKMDFLGLRTLSIIDNSLEMIERNYKVKIDSDQIDLKDEKTFQLIGEGNTGAVFQFESQGMQEYLRQLKPNSIEELSAMNALYRPGPMANIPEFIERKEGKKPISYLDERMGNSLNETYGIIVYQEQVMQLVRDLAGFSLSQADILRRAMGKKDEKVMSQMKPLFIKNAGEIGISKKNAEEIYNLIGKFANYGFNKSHAVAYSILAFQTAFLKANYTAEFLAATMSAEQNDSAKVVRLIDEAKRFDIKVLPPDINRSTEYFTVDNGEIIFGLSGIKNVGVPTVKSIVKAREEKPFSSFFDFVKRVDVKVLNKRAIESLICAGAFDSIHKGKRAALFATAESAIEYSKAFNNAEDSGMDSLFLGAAATDIQEPKLPEIPEWNEDERLNNEKEVLSFYVSGNPLNKYKVYIDALSTLQIADKESALIGEQVRICGMIKELRTQLDRRNKTIAFLQIEDLTGTCECVCWSDTYSSFKDLINEDAVLMVIGKSELDGDKIKVYADEILSIERAAEKYAKGLAIHIDLEKVEPDSIKTLQSYCSDANMNNTVLFNVFDNSKKYSKRYIANGVNISFKEETISNVTKVFGSDNVKLLMYK
ncbi:MAG: DNA polymerase III subunit alpha [Ignavibacteria bacterium]|jgi:DNA polymerase-3 subunit alpha|nr:DNA polymerase III subunit alpha [Ignavibacteria bacterium]